MKGRGKIGAKLKRKRGAVDEETRTKKQKSRDEREAVQKAEGAKEPKSQQTGNREALPPAMRRFAKKA
jgi:hypothetical protein